MQINFEPVFLRMIFLRTPAGLSHLTWAVNIEIFSSFSLYKVPSNERNRISYRLLNLKLFKEKNSEKLIILWDHMYMIPQCSKNLDEMKNLFVRCIILFLSKLVWKKNKFLPFFQLDIFWPGESNYFDLLLSYWLPW